MMMTMSTKTPRIWPSPSATTTGRSLTPNPARELRPRRTAGTTSPPRRPGLSPASSPQVSYSFSRCCLFLCVCFGSKRKEVEEKQGLSGLCFSHAFTGLPLIILILVLILIEIGFVAVHDLDDLHDSFDDIRRGILDRREKKLALRAMEEFAKQYIKLLFLKRIFSA